MLLMTRVQSQLSFILSVTSEQILDFIHFQSPQKPILIFVYGPTTIQSLN